MLSCVRRLAAESDSPPGISPTTHYPIPTSALRTWFPNGHRYSEPNRQLLRASLFQDSAQPAAELQSIRKSEEIHRFRRCCIQEFPKQHSSCLCVFLEGRCHPANDRP